MPHRMGRRRDRAAGRPVIIGDSTLAFQVGVIFQPHTDPVRAVGVSVTQFWGQDMSLYVRFSQFPGGKRGLPLGQLRESSRD